MKKQIGDGLTLDKLGNDTAHIGGNQEFSITVYHKKYVKWTRCLHYHDFYELEFVINGEAAHDMNGIRVSLHRGNMFLVRPTDIHRYELTAGQTLDVFTLRFYSGFLPEKLMRAISEAECTVADFSVEYHQIKRVLDNTLAEYTVPDEWSFLLYRETVIRLVTELIRKIHRESSCNLIHAIPIHSPAVNATARIINEEYANSLTIQKIAERLHISPNYLGKIFHENMKMTFGQYLKRVRLLWAMNRISHSSDSLQRIALECGFSSQSVFTREFRSYYGKSPTDYRHTDTAEKILDNGH